MENFEFNSSDLIFSEDMLNNENDTLRERVSYLEKKTHDQQDDIACLRSTLADVLRRVANLEGRGMIKFLLRLSDGKNLIR